MAFRSKGDGVENKRQSLSLSEYALSVIQSDMATFGVEKDSTFLNRIITYFIPVADASIELRLEEYRAKMDALLAFDGGSDSRLLKADQKERAVYVNRLVESRRKELKEKADSYERGNGEDRILIWLNKENMKYLGDQDQCGEDKHYGGETRGRGRYLKSLIEEYARLPYVKREMVYYRPLIKVIEEDLQKRDNKAEHPSILLIETKGHTRFDVSPYKILQDPLSTANYLVGYSRRPNHPAREKKPCSFRISNILSIEERPNKSAALSKESVRELEEQINVRGVQFMLSGADEIRVRLTPAGRVRYRRQVHLRPEKIREEAGNVFVFNCTQAQAEYYFFRYGADAEILSPPELRRKVQGMYEAALRTYRRENGESSGADCSSGFVPPEGGIT